jgi:hypothetical protein
VDSPVTSITGENVFTTDATAISVLNGIYAKMSNETLTTGGYISTSLYLGVSADELRVFSGSTNNVLKAYYQNNLSSINTEGAEYWTQIYPYVYTANAAIEGLKDNTKLTAAVQKQLLGEAKFIRAFSYFYLINLYGSVPLVLTTDYVTNSSVARTDAQAVWNQIVQDLQDAQSLLSDNFLNITLSATSSERVRPTKWAAQALLARVYLYTGNLAGAEQQASAVIDNKSLFDTVSLSGVFLKNSMEAIWQLQPVNVNRNTQDAQTFLLPGVPDDSHPVYLSEFLMNTFESGDNRKTTWVGSVTDGSSIYYYPNKYAAGSLIPTTPPTPPSEYMMVLRLGEQYLIRAEARAKQNKLSEALVDLNVIRRRAGLADTALSSQLSLLAAIQKERQVELFTEWGHRWLDLKRTATIDAIMSVVTPTKGGNWSSYKQYFPVTLSELRANKRIQQTPGY